MNPDETPREHVANAIQILLAIPKNNFGTSMLWAEDRRKLQRRLEAALIGLEKQTNAMRSRNVQTDTEEECFI